jgi:predicted nucleic acid-binding protein
VPPPFLDSNVLLLHLTQEDPELSARATAYLARIEQGEIEVMTSDIVIFETVFTLQRGFRLARAEIREMVVPIVDLPGIVLPGKRRLREAFDLYVEQSLPFADAYHVALMRGLGVTRIATFDRDFDRVADIERVPL